MGVPKFFRWMSERYPAISQLIADNRIPEFDCLYVSVIIPNRYLAFIKPNFIA